MGRFSENVERSEARQPKGMAMIALVGKEWATDLIKSFIDFLKEKMSSLLKEIKKP